MQEREKDGHLAVYQFLGEPKVGELDVTVPVQQYVFRLQVPVHDLPGVQLLDGTHDLRRVEESGATGEVAPVM